MSQVARAVGVVIGAAGGLGLACARALAPRFELVVADARSDALDRAVAALNAEGIRARSVVCDVLEQGSVDGLADAVTQVGTLGALVHAAGLGAASGDGRRILETNLVGTAVVLDAFEPLGTAGTSAVCFASLAGHRRRPREFDQLLRDPRAPGFLDAVEREVDLRATPRAGYELSKRGVILLCEQRAAGWGKRGARIVSVSPGLVDAGMGAASRRHATVSELTALGRLATADDVARVVAFLCSEKAAYVTGTDVLVDGGAHAGMRHHAPIPVADDLDSGW